MLRYNQGFKKFGPMEQCSDGEWIKFKDHEQVINERDFHYKECLAYWQKLYTGHDKIITQLKTELLATENANTKLFKKLNKADNLLICACLTMTASVLLLIFQ